MYRVLLVDDEAHSVRGLQAGVRWERLGVGQVFTAHSLRQAQEVFEREPVDLMVCDIEMPQGSGLELLSWVREAHPRTETVFLTCHSDFYYAKQAIQLSSFDYLLKPVDYEELETVLAKALEKIGKEREEQRFKEMYRKYAAMWEAHRPMRKERYWREIVEQTLPPLADKIEERASEHNLPYTADMRFLPVYVRLREWHKPLSEREQKIMEYALRNAAEEKLAEGDPAAAVVPVGGGSLLVVVPVGADGEEESKRMLEACEEYVHSCCRYFSCDLVAYIGRASYAHRMAGALKELRQADADNVTLSNRALLAAELPRTRLPFDPPPLKDWAEWMKTGAREKLTEDIERYLSRYEAGQDVLDAAGLHRIYQDFMQMVYYVLQLKGMQANEVFSDNLLTDKPPAVLQSVHAFREWAVYVVDVALNRICPSEGSLSIVERVKRFIAEQLGEQELSREEIAGHVYLNPDYLTRLFKKETGASISDYLQQQRIEYAKRLLKQTDQSISDIAVASGYSNLSYFSTIFKKAVGTTPADYRRGCSCAKP